MRRAGVRPDKSLSPFEIRLYRHYRLVHGVRIALAFTLTFLLVRLLNVPEGTWPGGSDGADLVLGQRGAARL